MLLTDQLKDTSQLTNTDQQIAAYILKHLAATSKMTIQQLAAATYTSHSAIVRLAQKLGYSGYRSFRYAITEAAYHQQHGLDQIDANFPFLPTDSPVTIAKNMAHLSTNTISRSLAQLDADKLAEAAHRITAAQRLFLFAVGDSQIRARSFQNKLTKIGQFAILAEEYNDENWTAATLTPSDCALFISYGGNTEQHTQLLQLLNEKKVPTILITGNAKSTQIQLADTALVTAQTEYENLKISTFASQISFEYVLDTLFALIYAGDYQQHLHDLKQHYQQLDEHHLI
ncbi:transcriptional regulator [Lactobacillus selangorensis]|uniref:Transcriptional regulator n=1 Tax=Lactobacillus selangorensis TaxID=81857 RepID=A0A0R2FTL0_9LACO|nr:MurR/RpiR family transcriptional regulator [Lactobacillus selangorensis]KRN28141.1 transcriptional regulator [Lactobacillus selangorensis]KRN30982.1 transcriptional regulator [Lactobacillus selangorensis]